MDRTFKRIIAVGIFFIALAAGAVALIVLGNNTTGTPGPLDSMRNNLVNTIIDVSGVKGRIDSELRENVGAMASELGVLQPVAEDIIDDLAISEWYATTLPASAHETSKSTVNVENTDVTITTYDDPSVLTVGAYGIDITLAVPESAQAYTPLLELLQYF